MAKRVSMKHMRMEAPDWIFPWRRPRRLPVVEVFAFLFVGGLFAFLIVSVRVQLSSPGQWNERKASVIRLIDNAQGRALTLRAQEGGPFLSRFEPSLWQDSITLENAAFEAARWTPPRYIPVIRDIPDEGLAPPGKIAIKGEPVFPTRTKQAQDFPTPDALALSPSLYPFSENPAMPMARDLPPFEGTVDEKMEAEPWRFIIRLDAYGNVRECISLTAGDENLTERSTQLESWLRGIQFDPAPDQSSRWISLGIGFTNQPTDGNQPQ